MTRLVAQVPVRAAEVRENRTVSTGRSSNMEALLGQMVGTEHDTDPCTHCTSSSGVFTQCVTVAGLFTGSCANCHYGSEGARCSFRKFTYHYGFIQKLTVRRPSCCGR
jgi:hypothetical protein